MKTPTEIRQARLQLHKDELAMYQRHAKESEQVKRRRLAIIAECPHENTVPYQSHEAGSHTACEDCGSHLP